METEQQIFERILKRRMSDYARRSWAKLSKAQRRERARNAVRARWKKAKNGR